MTGPKPIDWSILEEEEPKQTAPGKSSTRKAVDTKIDYSVLDEVDDSIPRTTFTSYISGLARTMQAFTPGYYMINKQALADRYKILTNLQNTDYSDFTVALYNKLLAIGDYTISGVQDLTPARVQALSGGAEGAQEFVNSARSFAKSDEKLSTIAKGVPALGLGLLEMVGRPIETLANTAFGEDLRALKPEERAEKMRDALADGIMIFATGGASMVTKEALAGSAFRKAGKEIAENLVKGTTQTVGREALLNAARGPRLGKLARDLIGDTVGGAVGGLAGGIVGEAGNKDAFKNIVFNTIMGIPLGFAVDFFQGVRGRNVLEAPELIQTVARNLLYERQLKLYIDDSINSGTAKLEAIATADNLAQAVITGKLRIPGAQIVRGVQSADIASSFAHAETLFTEKGAAKYQAYEDEIDIKERIIADIKAIKAAGTVEFAADRARLESNLIREEAELKELINNPPKLEDDDVVKNVRQGISRKNADGTFDVLIADKNTPTGHIEFFQRTGFIPQEEVSVNGKSYFVQGQDGDVIKLKDSEGNELSVKHNDIRDVPNAAQATIIPRSPNTVEAKLEALKAKMAKGSVVGKEFKGSKRYTNFMLRYGNLDKNQQQRMLLNYAPFDILNEAINDPEMGLDRETVIAHIISKTEGEKIATPLTHDDTEVWLTGDGVRIVTHYLNSRKSINEALDSLYDHFNKIVPNDTEALRLLNMTYIGGIVTELVDVGALKVQPEMIGYLKEGNGTKNPNFERGKHDALVSLGLAEPKKVGPAETQNPQLNYIIGLGGDVVEYVLARGTVAKVDINTLLEGLSHPSVDSDNLLRNITQDLKLNYKEKDAFDREAIRTWYTGSPSDIANYYISKYKDLNEALAKLYDDYGAIRNRESPRIGETEFFDKRFKQVAGAVSELIGDTSLLKNQDFGVLGTIKSLSTSTNDIDRLEFELGKGDVNKNVSELQSVKQATPTPAPGSDAARARLLVLKQEMDGVKITPLKNKLQDKYDRVLNQYFAEFYHTISQLAEAYDKLRGSASINFNNLFESFVQEKGFTQADIPALRNEFVSRFNKRLEKLLPDEEHAVLKATIDRLLEERQRHIDANTEVASRLSVATITNNMYFDMVPGGGVILRRVQDGKVLEKFSNGEEALAFVNKSGQEKNIDLVDSPVPDGVVLPPSMPVRYPKAYEQPFEANYGSKFLGGIADYLNIRLPWLTARGDYFKSIDNTYRTSLYARVFDSLQVLHRQYVSKVTPLKVKFLPLDNVLKGMTSAERALLLDYTETLSANEVRSSLLHRSMTKQEVTDGQWLYDNKVDLDKVFKYRRAYINAEKRGLEPEAFQAVMSVHKDQMQMDDLHMKAFEMFQRVTASNMNTSSLLAITRYAQALDPKFGLTRDEFLKQRVPEHLKGRFTVAARMLDDHFRDLSKLTGIAEDRIIRVYIPHYRQFPDAIIEEDILKSRRPDEFVSELIRTGELNNDMLDRDPMSLLVRYATGAIKKELGFNEAWNNAKNAISAEVKRIALTAPKNAQQIETRMVDYLEGMAGRSKRIADATAEHTSEFLKTLGIQRSPKDVAELFSKTFNRYIGIAEASAQGLRPVAGARDFVGMIGNYYALHGLERTRRLLKYLAPTGEMRELREAFKKSGQFGEFSPIEFSVPGEQPGVVREFGRGLMEGYMNVMFTGSMQKTAYDNFHSAAFLESFTNTAEALKGLVNGSENKAQVYKKIGLSAFDPSVQLEFDRLITKQQYQDAAKFLARVNGAQTGFVYGAMNHPLGWDKLAGKVFGQFGQWTAWQSRFVGKLATLGDLGERVGRMRRFSEVQIALRAADAVTGFNLSGWMTTPNSLLFGGGPLVTAYQNARDATNDNEFIATAGRKNLLRNATLMVPGYSAVSGWWRAFEMWQNGYLGYQVAGQALGARVDEQNKNWWDEIVREGYTISVPTIDDSGEYYKLKLEEVNTGIGLGLGYERGPASVVDQWTGNTPKRK